MQLNKIQKNIITVRGRERSLTIKQKNLFANLEKYKLDFSSLHNDKNNKERKLFFEIGFGSGDICLLYTSPSPRDY